MGEFSRLDRQIQEAEKQYLNTANAQEEILEQYFEEKRKRELQNRSIHNMSWEDCELLNDMRKGINDKFFDENVSNPKAEDMKAECQKYIDAIIRHPNATPEIIEKMMSVESLLGKLNTDKPTEKPQKPEEEIYDEPNFDIGKAIIDECTRTLSIQKSNGVTIVSGWSTIEEIDKSGDFVPVSDFEPHLQKFFKENGKVCINHDEKTIVGNLRSYEIRKNNNGKLGIYVTCDVQPHIEKMIIDGALTGFSWSLKGDRMKKCEKNSCYKNIKTYGITELSIVGSPMNQGATIERIAHNMGD